MAEKKNRRGFSFNIGTFLFGAVFVYIIITLILYLTTDHVSSYMVTSGTLSENDTTEALALRKETIVDASGAGYINYYAESGAKVSKDDIVCGISDTKNSYTTGTIDDEDKAAMRSQMEAFSKAYDPDRFGSVYDLQYALSSAAMKNDDTSSRNGNAIKAPSDGVITYTEDGYESLTPNDVTTENFDPASYKSTTLKTDDEVASGSPVFRIASDDTWNLVFPVSDRQYSALASKSAIKVRFAKDGQTETGDLTLFDKDNVHYAVLTLYSGMVRYCTDRYLDIELVTNTQSGLKIPISAIVNKEFYVIPASFMSAGGDDNSSGFLKQVKSDNGDTTTEFVETDLYEDKTLDDGTEVVYVDENDFKAGDIIIKPDSSETFTIGETGTLEGVYCTNRGYAQFRKIEVLDQNEEFCLVKEGTAYGISQYDYIVRDSSTVNESQILRG